MVDLSLLSLPWGPRGVREMLDLDFSLRMMTSLSGSLGVLQSMS
jgi:hypothetical protein